MSHEEADGMLRVLLASVEREFDIDPTPILSCDNKPWIGLRAFNIIKYEFKNNTMGQLSRLTAQQLLDCRGFGMTSLKCIRDALKARGLYLAGESPS
jgi:hypothetical protein